MCCKKTSWIELHLKKNIYVCILHCFLVINVCNKGKTLCSPCILLMLHVKFIPIIICLWCYECGVQYSQIGRHILQCHNLSWMKQYWAEIIFNPLKPELNPICYLLALLGAHHFLHVGRIRVKLLTFRWLMSCIYGVPILDVSRSHTTTQHSR